MVAHPYRAARVADQSDLAIMLDIDGGITTGSQILSSVHRPLLVIYQYLVHRPSPVSLTGMLPTT